jgi:hypothetical protein
MQRDPNPAHQALTCSTSIELTINGDGGKKKDFFGKKTQVSCHAMQIALFLCVKREKL